MNLAGRNAAPLLRIVTARIRPRGVMWPPLIAATVGLIASLMCFLLVSAQEMHKEELEFEAIANNHALIVQQGIDDYLRDVAALRALFESADDAVTRGEFETFAGKVLQGQTAILSVSWLPRVGDGDRSAHELATAQDGISDYHIRMVNPDGKTVVAAQQPEYFPVYYRVDVENPGQPYVYGVNQADGGIRGKALEEARDTGQISISENLDIRSGAANRRGILMVSPVYRKGSVHTTVEERRRDLVGFLRGVFETSAMIETILKSSTTPAGLDLYLFGSDATPVAAANLLYVHPSLLRQGPFEAAPRATLFAGRHQVSQITMSGHPFTLITVPAPGGLGGSGWMTPWLTLAATLILTAAATAYFRASGRHARHLQAANGELDAALMDLSVSGAQLTTQNIRFNAALNNMLQGLVMYDAHERIVVCNERFIKMYGLSPEIVKPGCSLTDVLGHMADLGNMRSDIERVRLDIVTGIERGAPAEQGRTADGREISISRVTIPQGGWVTTFEDVTERREAEEKIARMSLHDGLTDLPNRRFFYKQIHDHLALAGTLAGREQAFAILCLDLDHFKSVNDTLGHSAGDELLRQVADRLRGCLRDTDVVARLGGDEFAIFQSSVTDPAETIALMSRLIEVIAEPFDLGANRVMIGLSIGVAMAPTDGAAADQLLKNADMALYRAKADGRGLYRFFEPEMDARMQARRAMELDLRQALLNEEFEVLYQPLVNLATNSISGFEALLRWHHPTKGTIPPDKFIPLAEETALIVSIGEWVLNQACLEAVNWPSDVMIAVNLSPVQFKKDLVLTVTRALMNSGLPGHRLELEITESVLLFNNEATIATLHQLRALGVRISMDDFGTGYSSLSYLRSFPFDKIKIDQSFVHDLVLNEDSQAIIRAVTGLGSSLKMATTGEGVETQEELDFLKKQGCTEAQGYFFSRPARAGDVRLLLAQQPGCCKAVA